MTGAAQRESPHLGSFWLVQATEDEARLLAAGCPLDQAEPYGDRLTFGPGIEAQFHLPAERIEVQSDLHELGRARKGEPQGDWAVVLH
jgi:hypothetical protein